MQKQFCRDHNFKRKRVFVNSTKALFLFPSTADHYSPFTKNELAKSSNNRLRVPLTVVTISE
jgi:hypothetical protein